MQSLEARGGGGAASAECAGSPHPREVTPIKAGPASRRIVPVPWLRGRWLQSPDAKLSIPPSTRADEAQQLLGSRPANEWFPLVFERTGRLDCEFYLLP